MSNDFRSYLVDGYVDVAAPFQEFAAVGTADYYEGLLPDSSFVAEPAAGVGDEVLRRNAEWALSRGNGEEGLKLLEQSSERQLFNASRRTVVENVRRERGAFWARRARVDSDCTFCRQRATQRPGTTPSEKYHDGCRCIAVAVRPGLSYEMPDYQWVS